MENKDKGSDIIVWFFKWFGIIWLVAAALGSGIVAFVLYCLYLLATK
jgi:hypothetical protein